MNSQNQPWGLPASFWRSVARWCAKHFQPEDLLRVNICDRLTSLIHFDSLTVLLSTIIRIIKHRIVWAIFDHWFCVFACNFACDSWGISVTSLGPLPRWPFAKRPDWWQTSTTRWTGDPWAERGVWGGRGWWSCSWNNGVVICLIV